MAYISAGRDYTATSRVLTFLPGGGNTLAAPVPGVEDNLFEGNEEYIATLTLPVAMEGVSLGADEARATIQDDDSKINL